MPKITPKGKGPNTIVVKTMPNNGKNIPQQWWKADSKDERANQLLSTVAYLKDNQQFRYRQASLFAMLYSNYPIYGWAGQNVTRMGPMNQLPSDRPTLNVIQSCIDTLVSRITQSRPQPMFLTDGGDYKQRNMAKKLNNFVAGEFYQTDAYCLGERALKDACILGDGFVKILEKDKKVSLERRLPTELLVDPNDGMYGCPRTLYEVQLVDRECLIEYFPKHRSDIQKAEQAYPENSGESTRTTSDQVMLVEGWRLPSSEEAKDGKHIIACTSGSIEDVEWDKDYFPFSKLPYSPRVLGYFAQGLAEQITGTQAEINKLLQTISASINLVGIPRVFVEEGSKVVSAHLNNQIGSIVKYKGVKPSYEVAPCVPAEMYSQLQRLVEYAYQQAGISTLAAAAQKPAGLNSGEAIRNYDDLQSDRFSTITKEYQRFHEDMAFKMFDLACDISERDGKYQTIYPGKDGTRKIDLPKFKEEKDDFILQCFDISALPKDPSGRLAKITEMIQAGMIDIREGRRLLDFPDLEQVERLENASEERILQVLDKIIDEGQYTPPDTFMDLVLAEKLAVQYYNLYGAAKLEDDKMEMIRNFITQVQAFKQQAMQPPPQQMAQMPQEPQGVPEARPVSDIMPQVPGVQ